MEQQSVDLLLRIIYLNDVMWYAFEYCCCNAYQHRSTTVIMWVYVCVCRRLEAMTTISASGTQP
jgi:hypothetical protein